MLHYIFMDADLEKKIHVKAHFRRDPATGKLIFIKDYDATKHGAPDHVLAAGDKVVVDNPKSKHHGKELHITGFCDTYNCVRGKIDGKVAPADFLAHTVTTPAVPPAPVRTPVAPVRTPATAPVAPVVPLSPPPTAPVAAPVTFIRAVDDLKLLGYAYHSADMQHEKHRIDTMALPALERRISKIRSPQKLYNYLRAVKEWMPNPERDILIPKIEAAIIACVKTTPAPVVAPAPVPAPTPVAAPTPVFSPGDKVRVDNPKSKFHGKLGVVSSYSAKYGARVKLVDGSTAELKATALVKDGRAPAPAPNPEPAPVAPNPEPALAPAKTVADFAHDKAAAWKLATAPARELAAVSGMLPLDAEAEKYIKRNLTALSAPPKDSTTPLSPGYNRATGYWGAATISGAKIPYAVTHAVSDRNITASMEDAFKGSGAQFTEGTAIAQTLALPPDEWTKQGYDYKTEVQPAIDGFNKAAEKHAALTKTQRAVNGMEILLRAACTIGNKTSCKYVDRKSGFRSGEFEDRMKTPLKEILPTLSSNFWNGRSQDMVDPEEFLAIAKAIVPTFKGNPGDMTVEELARGVLQVVVSKGLPDSPSHPYRLIAEATPGTRYANNGRDIHVTRTIFPFLTATGADELWDALKKRREYSRHEARQFFGSQFALNEHLVNYTGNARDAITHNPAVHDQVCANIATKVVQRTITATRDREFKAQLFHKDIMAIEDPRVLGAKVGRNKSTDITEAYAKVVKPYIIPSRAAVAKKAPSDPSDPPPASLGCTFRSVTEATKQKVIDNIAKSWDHKEHGGFYFKVHGVYKIGGMDVYDKFKKIEDDRDNGIYGYHGTSFTAAAGISKTSFRPSSWGMLDAGVYVSTISSKSCQYLHGGCGYHSRKPGARGVLLLNKASLGTVHNAAIGAPNTGPKETKSRAAAHSVFAPKFSRVRGHSTPMRNDEHVVKDANAVIPMYWIDIELTDRKRTKP